MSRDEIAEAVYKAIDTANEVLDSEAQLVKEPHTPITGDGTTLDSLGVVNVVAAVEETMAKEFGVSVSLTDQTAPVAGAENPLRTVETLVDHLFRLVGGRES